MTAYQIPTEFLNTNPNSKATFRPGGDAAYVSYLLGGIINEIADFGPERLTEGETFDSYIRRIILQEAANLGFSEALKFKFLNAAYRILDRELARQAKADVKAAKKALKAKDAEPTYTEHAPVKIGRWEYPARELFINGQYIRTERNTKRDGSGEWVDAEGN